MTGIDELHRRFLDSTGPSSDTRAIAAGSMFFALKGPRFNANAFAAEAIAKGARCAVVDDPVHAKDDRYLLVTDTLSALQKLARHHRRQFNIPVLAITGSNGKTTTKELVHAVLSVQGRTLATEGNLNNHIGVPLTLLRLRPDHAFAVIEMGASKPGDISELAAIAEPTHGLITNIGKAHLEGFGGPEGVLRTKTELYRWLAERRGTAFVNADDALLVENLAGVPNRIGYGTGECQVRGGLLDAGARLALWFLGTGGGRKEARTRLVGAYNLPNALAAVAVGRTFGATDQAIVQALERYEPGNNRSQWIETERNQVILDAYNANPTSVEAALRNFAAMQADRPKLAVLGDMLELGPEGPDEHARIIHLCDQLRLPVILVGPIYGRVADGAHSDAGALLNAWSNAGPTGKLILLKGSRGLRLEQLLTAL
ncbi:MAG: UDP-N-acetylmuramoyl-tripeptide--D-alanyl-D-alanine ligase [Flavobacteriales bacterium]|nr:UDP-N-acetylmuramoyl-tripeptide--D-alanyl-D-alanine ligase [Flavobacteriales bacterium]